ncbi:acylglycerol lipase [Phakopsora pachyrhizi]|nr:acylglycerol lipase [Phakopsora pachyrhizi]
MQTKPEVELDQTINSSSSHTSFKSLTENDKVDDDELLIRDGTDHRCLDEWIDGPDKKPFFVRRWIPKGKVLSNFMEHVARYDHVFSLHAKNGIEVFSFDQRGFGRTAARTKSQGRTSWSQALEDLNFFIVNEADPKISFGEEVIKVFLMGHSMGGGLAFAYSTRQPSPIGLGLITGGLILSSPLIQQASNVATNGTIIRLGSFIGAVLPKLPIRVGVSPEDICRDKFIQEKYEHDPLCAPIGTFKGVADMILGGKRLISEDFKNYPKNLKLLAVHGSGDKVTSHDATKELIRKTEADEKQFKSFDGYYHEMHNEPDELKLVEINFIIDWIKLRS